jgi:hypothetical protein
MGAHVAQCIAFGVIRRFLHIKFNQAFAACKFAQASRSRACVPTSERRRNDSFLLHLRPLAAPLHDVITSTCVMVTRIHPVESRQHSR